jgi:cardiolipin synthase
MWTQVLAIFFLLEALMRVALALRVIGRRLTAGQTMGWLLILLFVPILSTVGYLLIGEYRLGARRARRYVEVTREIEKRIHTLVRQRDENWTARAWGFESFANLLTSSTGIPPLRGNRLTMIESTEEFFGQLIAEIDRATHHVHLITFIWTTRGQAIKVGQALARAARRGVQCRVIVDDVGSKEFTGSDLEREMIQAGVRVAHALPVNAARLLLARVDIRNHRKIAIIDGAVAFTGSHNIADPDFKIKLMPRVGRWVDSTLRVQGPAVHVLQGVFLCDWAADADETIDDYSPYLPPVPASEDGTAVQVVPSGPGHQPTAIHHAILAMIHDAREELVITTPYFVPDEATRTALKIAAGCGVKVTLIIPERGDHRLVQAAGRSYYKELMQAGVRIAHYRKGLLHSKAFCVDRKMCVITSVNVDMRSFFVNFELSMFIYDEAFSREVRLMQERYLLDSVPLAQDTWCRRHIHRRFVENVCHLFGPLL